MTINKKNNNNKNNIIIIIIIRKTNYNVYKQIHKILISFVENKFTQITK